MNVTTQAMADAALAGNESYWNHVSAKHYLCAYKFLSTAFRIDAMRWQAHALALVDVPNTEKREQRLASIDAKAGADIKSAFEHSESPISVIHLQNAIGAMTRAAPPDQREALTRKFRALLNDVF